MMGVPLSPIFQGDFCIFSYFHQFQQMLKYTFIMKFGFPFSTHLLIVVQGVVSLPITGSYPEIPDN